MSIGDLVKRKDRKPNPDGGIGGLTEEELAPFNDLLNDGRCECGLCTADCSSPIPGQPKKLA